MGYCVVCKRTEHGASEARGEAEDVHMLGYYTIRAGNQDRNKTRLYVYVW